MAQIIKHRRGSLESISGATKRAGELLVVTGSSGITAANGDSILFVGIDGSTATPSNKVLQGTEVPNLTGASYDTSVDGIPFYDTSAQKLYILNKGGNVEVKATANTGGTGIVSGSEQVTALLPTGTVSGSSQIVSILSDLNTFSASEESKNSTLATYTGSVDIHISAINTFSASQESKDSTLATYTGSVDVHIAAINTFSASEESKNSTLATYTQSVDADLTELFSSASNHEGRIDSLEAFSSSLGDGFATDAELSALSSSVATSDGVQNQRLSSIEGFTSSIDTTIKTKLNGEGVISGSSQVTISSTTGFSDFSSSLNTKDVELFATASDHEGRIDAIEEAIGNGSNIDVRLTNLELTSASHDGRLDQLEADSGSQAGRLNNLELFSSSVETAIILDGQNVTINGNFTVSGTQTVVDSTTVQIGDNIIELNGSAAANGGLYVVDATAPNLATGSLLWDSTNDYWKAGPKDNESKILVAGGMGVISGSSQVNADSITNFDENVKAKLDADGVISGSSQVNADSITNFDENVKAKLDADGVISGSSQVQIDSVTGFSSFSSSVDSRVDVLEAAVGEGSSLDTRLDALEVFSGSQESKDSTLATYTASVDSDLTELFASASDHETRVDALEAFSSSLDAGFVNQAELASATGALETADSAQQARLASLESFSGSQESKDSTLATYTGSVDSRLNQLEADSGSQAGRLNNLESFTSSIDATIKTKLNVEAVVSSSAQIVTLLSNQATDFGTGRVSADSIGNVDGTSTITGSFVGDGSQLTGLVTTLKLTGSDASNSSVDLLTQGLSFASGSGLGLGISVSGQTVTFTNVNASTSAKGVASFDADDFSVSSGNVSIKEDGVRAANLNPDVAGTGISLNGVDSSIEVDYGSTAGTAVEGNTSITVQGTANEIEVSGGSITLGAGGTVTVGLPDSVTIATASIQDNLSVGGDVTITGNLSVLGTTTTIDSTTVQIGDNVLELNYGGAQTTAGLLVTDATAPNTVSGSLVWDGTNDYWKAGALGSEKELARLNTDPTTNRVLKANADGLLVDSLIHDDGTNITITGSAELRIQNATANSFVYFDSNKSLEAVTPSNAGDVIQWNGSSFVASNELDGGTF